ncbi:MAG: serine hydrolase [Clostridiales bacterium]|nr:serine hydrolase [Clostridiales bacterium]
MKKTNKFLIKIIVFVFVLTCFKLPGITGFAVNATPIEETENYKGAIKAAREAVAKELSSGLASSATVAIMVDGKIIYAEGFGLRDRANSLPVETDTQFNIGSISKIFTAASILILEQEGKLSLDNPVTDYIPNFTMNDERYKDITVRMLINHSSGLPGTYMKDGFAAAKNRSYVEETLKELKTGNLVNDPGKISIYCNDGFTVAEAVIEHVSGMSYPEFLENKIFSKMSLDNTSAYFKDGNENIARVYEKDNIMPLPLEYVNILGSGGISSTAIDLCKYGEILQSGVVLNSKMIKEYTKLQCGPATVPVGDPIFNVGLGWDYVQVYKFKNQGVNVVAKNGGTLQYNSQLYVLPKEHINVAVIFAGPANPTAVTNAILQALLEAKGIVKKPLSDISFPKDAEMPISYKDYEGFYAFVSETGFVRVEVSYENNSLVLSAYDGKGYIPTGLFPYKENGRFYRPDGINYSFADHEGRKVIMIHPDSTDAAAVNYEKLDHPNNIDSSKFSGKVWVPRDFGLYDFYATMFQTVTIPEIPGYIFINDGSSYTPLALKNPISTRMSLNYSRDQYEINLQEIEGETLLYNYGQCFADASNLPIISDGDTLQIDSNGQNKADKMGFSDLIHFAIPDKGRVLVFSSKFDLSYDSMLTNRKEAYAEKGSYIVTIGKAGDVFEITEYELFKDISRHWAKDYINQLVGSNAIKGKKDDMFLPDENITGYDFMELVQRATGMTVDDEIASAQAITRMQAISILADVLALVCIETDLDIEEITTLTERFSDLNEMGHEFKSKAAFFIKLGILQGNGNDMMAPKDYLSRSEAAALVCKMIRNVQ